MQGCGEASILVRSKVAWASPLGRSAATRSREPEPRSTKSFCTYRYTPAKPHIWKVACATRTTNFVTLSGNSKICGKVPPNCESCSSALDVQPRATRKVSRWQLQSPHDKLLGGSSSRSYLHHHLPNHDVEITTNIAIYRARLSRLTMQKLYAKACRAAG